MQCKRLGSEFRLSHCPSPLQFPIFLLLLLFFVLTSHPWIHFPIIFKFFFPCCIFSSTACLWSLSPLDFFTSIIFCFVTFVFPLSASSSSPEPVDYHLFSTCLCLLSEVEYLQGPNYISSWLHFNRDHARNPKPYHMGPKFGLPGSRLYLSPGRPGFKTTINADTRAHTHRRS